MAEDRDDPTSAGDVEAAIRAAFTAFNERRWADFAAYVTDDIVERYPQSGERLVGRDRQRRFHEAFPNPSTFEVHAVWSRGDIAVVEADEHAADGRVWKDCLILHLRDGKVAQMTGYFGEPFTAPAWRRAFMEVEGD